MYWFNGRDLSDHDNVPFLLNWEGCEVQVLHFFWGEGSSYVYYSLPKTQIQADPTLELWFFSSASRQADPAAPNKSGSTSLKVVLLEII